MNIRDHHCRRRFSLVTRFLSLISLIIFASADVILPETDQQQLQVEETATAADSSFVNNATVNATSDRDRSFAGMIDRALEKEFAESDQNEENDAGGFNNSVAGQQIDPELAKRFSQFEIYSDICLEHLNELDLKEFANLKPELEFVKLILARSPVLKKLRISLYEKVTKDEESEMLRVLLRSTRASPAVKIFVEPGV